MRLCWKECLRRVPCPERQDFEVQFPAFAGTNFAGFASLPAKAGSCFLKHGGSAPCSLFRVLLLHPDKFHIKHQSRVWRDSRRAAAIPVAKCRGNDEAAFAADFHRRNPFVPALDDLALP